MAVVDVTRGAYTMEQVLEMRVELAMAAVLGRAALLSRAAPASSAGPPPSIGSFGVGGVQRMRITSMAHLTSVLQGSAGV